MMKLVVCGNIKDKWLKEGISEYVKRIQPYEKLEVIEVGDEKAPETNSPAQNEQVKDAEGQKMLKHVKPTDYVILLDLAGKEKDSLALADYIQHLYNNNHRNITFIIGGSLGVSRALIERANFRWKLSANTFTHQMCRLLLVEQIYRAFRILHHEPYHK